MALSPIKCDKCAAALFPDHFGGDVFFPCPNCHSLLAVEVFPAILRPLTPTASAPLLVAGESSCFYHPEKKAALVCEGCGRFLCSLCDLEVNGRHLCPQCLESAQKKSKFKDLENSRMLWDQLALALATLPLFGVWLSILGAPMALYIVVRHWKSPCSILGKSHARFIAAAIIALLELVGWGTLITYLLMKK